MTLEKYTRSDLVSLPPTASLQAAGCALRCSGVGCVLVEEDGRLVGVVTDRDLAVRAACRALDPTRTPVGEVMTRNVATLPPSASEGEAGRLMLDRAVRRVPIVEGGTAVGIVTLDDLILDQEMSPSLLCAILRAQLTGASRDSNERTSRTRARRMMALA
jgi:CBS domain-containing protein